jgi:hypothetical protein
LCVPGNCPCTINAFTVLTLILDSGGNILTGSIAITSCLLTFPVPYECMSNRTTSQFKSKSKSHYDRRSVSQSVCLGVEPNLGLLTRICFSKLLSCLFAAPSLTRGRVCHMSVFVIEVYNSQSLFITIISVKLKMYSVKHIYNTIKYIQYIQTSFSPGFVQQIMPYLLVT